MSVAVKRHWVVRAGAIHRIQMEEERCRGVGGGGKLEGALAAGSWHLHIFIGPFQSRHISRGDLIRVLRYLAIRCGYGPRPAVGIVFDRCAVSSQFIYYTVPLYEIAVPVSFHRIAGDRTASDNKILKDRAVRIRYGYDIAVFIIRRCPVVISYLDKLLRDGFTAGGVRRVGVRVNPVILFEVLQFI